MSKKVGILTFHCTDNPGSVLQAYALQQAIRTLGYECDILNYKKLGWLDPTVNAFSKSLSKKLHIPESVARFIALETIRHEYKKYEDFRSEHLKIVPEKPMVHPSELMPFVQKYDKFIAGSDQIWNFRNPKVDETFFLRFADDTQKIAYAASFGTDEVDAAHREKAAEWISHIPSISVREQKGKEIVKDLTGCDVPVVLDPSLLLTKEQWSDIAKMPKRKDYILVYVRERRSELFDNVVFDLSKKTGLSVIELTPYRSGKKIGKRVICPGPQEWLGYFLNASYVVTNSFHGMAFSLNFNKQFYSVLLHTEPTNSRITGILEQFSLNDRIITNDTDFSELKPIDYDRVNASLAVKRETSLGFLKNALKGD